MGMSFQQSKLRLPCNSIRTVGRADQLFARFSHTRLL